MKLKEEERYQAIPTATHRENGTRHVACGEFGKPICGTMSAKLKHDRSPMLASFPEDFGDLPQDCEKCASMGEEKISEQITEIEFEY